MFDIAIFLQFQHPSSFSVLPILLFPFLSFILLLLLTDIHMTICIQVKWECVVYHFRTLSTPSHKYIPSLSPQIRLLLPYPHFSSLSVSLSLSLSLLGEAVFPQCFPFTSNTFQIRLRFPLQTHCKDTKMCMRKRGELSSVMLSPPVCVCVCVCVFVCVSLIGDIWRHKNFKNYYEKI